VTDENQHKIGAGAIVAVQEDDLGHRVPELHRLEPPAQPHDVSGMQRARGPGVRLAGLDGYRRSPQLSAIRGTAIEGGHAGRSLEDRGYQSGSGGASSSHILSAIDAAASRRVTSDSPPCTHWRALSENIARNT